MNATDDRRYGRDDLRVRLRTTEKSSPDDRKYLVKSTNNKYIQPLRYLHLFFSW